MRSSTVDGAVTASESCPAATVEYLESASRADRRTKAVTRWKRNECHSPTNAERSLILTGFWPAICLAGNMKKGSSSVVEW